MTWTDQRQKELAAHYARVGYVPGERWPAPPSELSPAQVLALFRRIPDGAGLAGYMAALAETASGR